MPLPATRVFHPDWSHHHRPTATDTMTAACRITRGEVTVHTGACRVIADGSNEVARIGTQDQLVVRYLVTVRYDTDLVQVGDVVHITDAVDTGLVGRRLIVKQVRYGSQQWERDLYADDEAAGLPAWTDQITIVRAPLVTGYGNSLVWDWDNATRTPVAAGIEPVTSNETTGARDQITTIVLAYVPHGTDVRVTDRVEWDGRTFEVDGEPEHIAHPVTGAPHHLQVRLRIDEGG